MKYIKFILLNVIVFGVFFFLLSLLFPNTINSNKTITVLANKEKIYHTILSLKDWSQWNEFDKIDGITITLKFANKDTIATVWRQKNGSTLLSIHNIITASNDSTIINWQLQEKMKWYQPLKKFAALFTDKRINYAMEISLATLKKQIEVPQANPEN
jgi:hypothetical protein